MCGNGSVRPVTEGAGGLGQVVARNLQQLLCNLDVVVRQRREAVGVVALLGERGLQVVRLQPLGQFDETLVALLEVRSHPERDLRASGKSGAGGALVLRRRLSLARASTGTGGVSSTSRPQSNRIGAVRSLGTTTTSVSPLRKAASEAAAEWLMLGALVCAPPVKPPPRQLQGGCRVSFVGKGE